MTKNKKDLDQQLYRLLDDVVEHLACDNARAWPCNDVAHSVADAAKCANCVLRDRVTEFVAAYADASAG